MRECAHVDTLLRGCRLRRRIYEPDDVILGVVGTLTSRDTAYCSLSRDPLVTGRNRRTRSDPSTRRNNRNSSSLVRVDSGLADESATASTASPSLTDDVRDELIVPPAPVISFDTAQHFGMDRNTPSFEPNISCVADEQPGRATGREQKENRINSTVNGSKRRRKKSTKKMAKAQNVSKTTEKLWRDGDDRQVRGQAWSSQGHSRSSHDESLWDVNGVKLWRFCAEVLGCSSREMPGVDVDSAGAAPQPGQRGRTVHVRAIRRSQPSQQCHDPRRQCFCRWLTAKNYSHGKP